MNAPLPAVDRKHRGTIFVEDAVLISSHSWPGEQFVQRFSAPKSAANAVAGSFVHVQCSPDILMRRPLSIMRANAEEGWIEVLYKVVGPGLQALGQAKPGDVASIIGPIGRGFIPHDERPRALLIGGGVGIPPMVFLAEQLKADSDRWQPLVLMGSELPFPFDVQESAFEADWVDASVNGAMPLMESLRVCSRLSSLSGFDGCYNGYVTELAEKFLDSLSSSERDEVEIFSCGPTPMLQAVAKLAVKYEVPAQVSLEEFMACAVGGCAGCAVEVQTDDGPAMKRVCVDGPVFDSRAVFPN